MWGEGALPSFFFGIDGGFLYMVFFLESGPRAMEPGLVLDLCPVSKQNRTCVRDRACGDWLDVLYIEREGTASDSDSESEPGGRPSGTYFQVTSRRRALMTDRRQKALVRTDSPALGEGI
ncbi:hypothetical protein Lalb_Chr00c24g0406931 (mitochondrion) [Lupinus albus]|uniref:Uncharacterized protein n=1 Tax=Lupinus albus TaxID=3870 RepID=A0A6A4N5F5_LUPAL|nr:hypothetical protein Lalb_Chr00c24g0406931 [Lupinus albus]